MTAKVERPSLGRMRLKPPTPTPSPSLPTVCVFVPVCVCVEGYVSPSLRWTRQTECNLKYQHLDLQQCIYSVPIRQTAVTGGCYGVRR